jgi:hypothetical protein
MERSLPILAVQVEAGMAREGVILVALDLWARGRMDMAIEAAEEALEVGDLDHLLELECQVVNGEEESGYLKGQPAEVVAIREGTGEEAEEGIKKIDANIISMWATWVMAFGMYLHQTKKLYTAALFLMNNRNIFSAVS